MQAREHAEDGTEEETGVEKELDAPVEIGPRLDPAPGAELDHRVGEGGTEEEQRDPRLVGARSSAHPQVHAEWPDAESDIVAGAGLQTLGAEQAVGVPLEPAPGELEGRAGGAGHPAEARLLPARAADPKGPRPQLDRGHQRGNA